LTAQDVLGMVRELLTDGGGFARLALADCFEEHGDGEAASLLRSRRCATASELLAAAEGWLTAGDDPGAWSVGPGEHQPLGTEAERQAFARGVRAGESSAGPRLYAGLLEALLGEGACLPGASGPRRPAGRSHEPLAPASR
jgi:hypothetical protein